MEVNYNYNPTIEEALGSYITLLKASLTSLKQGMNKVEIKMTYEVGEYSNKTINETIEQLDNILKIIEHN